MEVDQTTVLVVENNEALAVFIEMALSERGLKVVLAGSGLDAIEIVQKQQIDAILTNVNLPGMSGPETVMEIQAIRPDIPCFYMTGSSELTKEQLPGAIEVFPKPFADMAAMVQRIKESVRRPL